MRFVSSMHLFFQSEESEKEEGKNGRKLIMSSDADQSLLLIK